MDIIEKQHKAKALGQESTKAKKEMQERYICLNDIKSSLV